MPAIELAYEPCSPEESVGGFTIGLEPEYTFVDGKVYDAVDPSQIWDELARAGECRLLADRVTSCEPNCPSGETCGPENACVPPPRAQDVGPVTVHGLAIPMQIQPNANTRSYSNPALPALPHPGFEPGADLRVNTAGGEYAPFELRGWGISPLVLGPAPIEVRGGQATRIEWQAPAQAGPARVQIQLNINLHGSTSSKIECDFADTGAAEIPAELIDGLIARGVTGFPTLSAARRTATSTDIEPGCVELQVTSTIMTSVEVEGVVSCNDASDCPSGQACLPVVLYCG